MNAEISHASTRQPLVHASRPRISRRLPRSTSRTYPSATRLGRLDSAMDVALTRKTARKRSCDARKQLTLSNGHGHGGFTAPIRSPMTVSATPAVALMRLVSAGTTASTWQVVMGVRESAPPPIWPPARTFPWADSALPATAEAVSSAPAFRSTLPMRPRLLLQCTRPLFTVAVTKAAYLRVTRQKSRKQSRASACIAKATCAPSHQAQLHQRAKVRRTSKFMCLSTGSTQASKATKKPLACPQKATTKKLAPQADPFPPLTPAIISQDRPLQPPRHPDGHRGHRGCR